jgi:hypothetical protein
MLLKVINAVVDKYGVVRGDIGDGGRKASELWKDIISIRKGFFNRIVC